MGKATLEDRIEQLEESSDEHRMKLWKHGLQITIFWAIAGFVATGLGGLMILNAAKQLGVNP